MTKISLEDAQARLAETVRRTEAGPVVLEDSGQPVAVVLSVEEYRRLSVVEARERERPLARGLRSDFRSLQPR